MFNVSKNVNHFTNLRKYWKDFRKDWGNIARVIEMVRKCMGYTSLYYLGKFPNWQCNVCCKRQLMLQSLNNINYNMGWEYKKEKIIKNIQKVGIIDCVVCLLDGFTNVFRTKGNISIPSVMYIFKYSFIQEKKLRAICQHRLYLTGLENIKFECQYFNIIFLIFFFCQHQISFGYFTDVIFYVLLFQVQNLLYY